MRESGQCRWPETPVADRARLALCFGYRSFLASRPEISHGSVGQRSTTDRQRKTAARDDGRPRKQRVESGAVFANRHAPQRKGCVIDSRFADRAVYKAEDPSQDACRIVPGA